MTDYSFKAKDGKKIYAAKWDTDKPTGIVQILHGMAEHIERYDDFAKYLNSRGYVVTGEDHRGHGKTAGSLEDAGWFAEKNGWDIVVNDNFILGEKIKAEYPGLPIYIFGHSMGTFITRKLISEYPVNARKVILSGTGDFKASEVKMVKLIAGITKFFKTGKAKAELLDKLSFSAMNKNFKPGRTGLEWLSRDESMVDKYVSDPYCGFITTAQFYLDFAGGISYLHTDACFKNTPKDIPLLFYSGEKDPVGGNTEYVKKVFNQYKENGFKSIEIEFNKDGRHESINEVNREEVYKFMADWLEK